MNLATKHNPKLLYRATTFFAVPTFLLVLVLTGRQDYWQTAGIVWLALCGCYVLVISTLGFINQPSGNKARGALVRTVVGLLGSVVWGGFFTAIYFFVYWRIFSREDISPR